MYISSTLLAQIFFFPFLIIGLSMFFDRENNIKAIDEITKDRGQLWISGFLFLMTGTIILAFTNLYDGVLNLFLSILGIHTDSLVIISLIVLLIKLLKEST